jgi:putative transcriptional regulator
MSTKVSVGIRKGLKEAVEFARSTGPRRGHRVSRVDIPEQIDVRAIREKLGLSQREFAAQFAVSLDTLRHWEQGLRRPRGPARILLVVIDRAPDAVQKALRAA